MRIFMIFLILFFIFAVLWVRSDVISIEYRLASLEEKKKELLREKRVLVAEKSSLTSFVRIEQTIGESLVFPDRKKFVYIYGSPENLMKTVQFTLKIRNANKI